MMPMSNRRNMSHIISVYGVGSDCIKKLLMQLVLAVECRVEETIVHAVAVENAAKTAIMCSMM